MRNQIRIWIAGILLLAPALAAQTLDLKLDSLASKAAEKAELDIDPATMGKLMSDGKLPGAALSTAKDVRIRNYRFAKEGEYSEKDLDILRRQVGEGTGWSRMVQVKEKRESVEIYSHKEGEQIRAFLIIACEATEVSVVYVAGDITPEQLKALVSSKIAYNLGQ